MEKKKIILRLSCLKQSELLTVHHFFVRAFYWSIGLLRIIIVDRETIP